MNKFVFLILFLCVSLAYVFNIDKLIARNFTPFNTVKDFYIENMLSISSSIEKYFDQANSIERLNIENEKLRRYKELYNSKQTELYDIQEITKHLSIKKESLTLVKALSYVDFNDFTRVWLDLNKQDDTIMGLISNNYAAGIVVQKKLKAQALLNGHDKANYAVYIGKYNAPGITHSEKGTSNIIAKYIPIWIDIKIGDEVITSGMDNIFFKGLKVGKVVGINKMADMQEAIIKPYAQVLKQRFFYVYKQDKIIKKTTKKIEKPKEKPSKKTTK